MKNDNAARQVIDLTNPAVLSWVRFYFRPLTPTQYYNEGYKHPDIRYDGDFNANIPVPIFFLFDLEKVLSMENTGFSQTSQAGNGLILKSGAQEFSKMNFDAIYSKGFENIEKMKAFRHAEIVHFGSMEIAPYLNCILCRNAVERSTLLNLLREEAPLAYKRYCGRIKAYNDKDIFENNGLIVCDCVYRENCISVSFSDSYAQKNYAQKMMKQFKINQLNPVDVRIEMEWFNPCSRIHHIEIITHVDYLNPKRVNITNLPHCEKANEIGVKIFLGDKLVCYMRQSLFSEEIIK